jgi:predicted phosphodiesterase
VNTKRILLISDLHAPYMHPDALKFLIALKRKYKPTLVVSLGDEVDAHAISFHDSDADLPSAGDELELASEQLQALEKVFPKMLIIDSNHGSLHLRKAKHHGIPLKYLATNNQIFGVGKGWEWHNDLTLKLPTGQTLYICHGLVKQGVKLAQQRGQCVSQGHFHTDFRIDYVGNPDNLLWSLQAGCLIDKRSLAFAYDKLNLNRPILGTGLVINGYPVLEPMVLNKQSRWIGRLV